MAVPIRKLVTLTPDLDEAIERFRDQAGLRSYSAAMALLVEKGLDYRDTIEISHSESRRVAELLGE